jgi:hypothetical protein
VIRIIDFIITFIFVIEMVLKIMVFGFCLNGPESYIRNSWNVMDFFIVAFSLVSLFAQDVNLGFIKILRMLRVFRPLRMISRNEGLKLAVLSLINAMPGVLNVLIISFLFFMLFGILGVNYFKGTFFSCILQEKNLETIVGKWDCVDYGG